MAAAACKQGSPAAAVASDKSLATAAAVERKGEVGCGGGVYGPGGAWNVAARLLQGCLDVGGTL